MQPRESLLHLSCPPLLPGFLFIFGSSLSMSFSVADDPPQEGPSRGILFHGAGFYSSGLA